MSSATSTDAAGANLRLKPDTTDPEGSVRLQPDDDGARHPADQRLQPWQFFVLAALACATAVTFMARGQGVVVVILLAVLMAATAMAGLAALRTVLPLVTNQDDRTPVVGQRTRAGLEREKMLALRALKDLEFDRAMGKLSEQDFNEMTVRLRARATRLMRQLDAGAGYRETIERDLAKRLGEKAGEPPAAPVANTAAPALPVSTRTCDKCSTSNDTDARFCKECGAKL